MVKLVGLQNRIHEKVKRYSLGMRQRLGVAQTLLHKPSVLILDEPTNGLDPAGIRELHDYLRTLGRQEGIAVIVSSHLLSEMELMCDRVEVIQAGKLIDVRSMYALKNGAAAGHIMVDVEAPEAAKEALHKLLPDIRMTVVDGALQLAAGRERIPELTRALVRAEIDVFGIRMEQRTLEDQFLAMTGGKEIV
ncbi:hypothetical protein J6TS7_33450 [Paenibacillus dendritiformis]|nr:hypothetical protein J6TS7_33450 [Paenibacillus dendritiformis]